MKKEGIGCIAPAVSAHRVDPAIISVLSNVADRRQIRDSACANRWVRGYSRSPHLIGLIGEFAVGSMLNEAMSTARTYDGGIDFYVNGIAIDVKSTKRLAVPAIRKVELERKLTNRSANVVVFAKQKSEHNFSILGWLPIGEIQENSELEELPSGLNYMVRTQSLRDIRHLKGALNKTVRNIMRYPGGKGSVIKCVAELMDYTGGMFAPEWYIEPFVGAGSMLAYLAKNRLLPKKILINDLDTSLAKLYVAARDRHEDLCNLILRNHEPTVDDWNKAKDLDGRIDDVVEAGYNKLILQNCSHAGIGYCAGGPQGGYGQNGDYQIGCRWNPVSIVRKIQFYSEHLRGAEITNKSVFDMDFPDDGFMFLDPPYVAKGESLYRHSLNDQMHTRLADLLRSYRGAFALTYDDHPLVFDLYSGWTKISHFINNGGNNPRKNREIVIARNARG